MLKALSDRVGVPVGTQLRQLQHWLVKAGLPLPEELPTLDAETAPDTNEVRVLCMYLAGPSGQTDLDATVDFYLGQIARKAEGLGIRVNFGNGTRYFWGKFCPVSTAPAPGLYHSALNLGQPDPSLHSLAASIGAQMLAGTPAGMEVLAFLAHSRPALRELAGTVLDEIPLANLKVGVPNALPGTLVPVVQGRVSLGHPELFFATISPNSTKDAGWTIPTVQPVR